MKKISKLISASALILTVIMLLFTVASAAIISPALSIIANDTEMAKCCLSKNDMHFCAEDFENALGIKKVNTLKIRSLPPATVGKLMLGSLEVVKNQTISRKNIKNLRFVPSAFGSSAENSECSFKFTVNGNDAYALSCSLFVLSELNFAPTVSLINPYYLNISTQKNISYYGTLKASDPENDKISYKIVSEPRKGLLTVTDKNSGSYVYTPVKNYTGTDSFRYIAQDKYGNASNEVTVSIKVTKAASDVVYSDMVGHWAHNAAIKVGAANIMCGNSVGNSFIFDPNGKVSRAEFVSLVMKAANISPDKSSEKTSFVDDADIPTQYKAYIVKAQKLGIINGCPTESGLCFMPNDSITRAEAAVILNNILNAEKPAVKPVFADSSQIPQWAESALYALNEIGVFAGSGGNISPYETLDRAMAAQLLCSVLEIKK